MTIMGKRRLCGDPLSNWVKERSPTNRPLQPDVLPLDLTPSPLGLSAISSNYPAYQSASCNTNLPVFTSRENQ